MAINHSTKADHLRNEERRSEADGKKKTFMLVENVQFLNTFETEQMAN